jgi:ATP-binding cassette subfamily B protein
MRDEKVVEKGKKWLKRELRSYRHFILFLCVLTALSTIFSLAFAYTIRYLINSASLSDKTTFLKIAVLLLVLLFARIATNITNNYLSERGRAKITTDLRNKVFGQILRSDYATIEKYHSGDLLSRLTSDVQEVAVDTVGLTPAVVGMLTQCLGAIVALFTIDPWFTLIFIIAGGIFGGLVSLFRKSIKKYQKELLETDAKSRAYIQEGLTSLLTVKAYGAEGKTQEKSNIFLKEYYNKRMQRNVLRSSMGGLFSLFSAIKPPFQNRCAKNNGIAYHTPHVRVFRKKYHTPHRRKKHL